MNQETNYQYDEISLRELIETLLRHKALIAGVTIGCILVAFVISFFIMSPVYEAKTVLMASQIVDKITSSPKGDGIEGLLDTISEYPRLTIDTYKEQITNPIILEEIIKELELNKLEITRATLKEMINLETINGTNLISISVKHTDKVLATEIANKLAEKFTVFISNMVKEHATKSLNYLTQQLDVEKQKLEESLLEYKEFLAQPKGVRELEMEIDSKINLLTSYKTSLSEEKIKEENLRSMIFKTEEELKNISPTVQLKKSLGDDAFLSQAIKEESNLGIHDIFSMTVITEEKNDLYFTLSTLLSDLKIQLAENLTKQENLKLEINNTQKELELLQAELAEKKHKESLITQKVEMAKSTYGAFTKKLEESRVAQSSAIGDSIIIVVSPAVEPIRPVSPNKTLNLAISAVLGLMMGVFIAFFIEYWKKSGEVKTIN